MVKRFFHKKYDKLKYDTIKKLGFEMTKSSSSLLYNEKEIKNVKYYNGDTIELNLNSLDDLVNFVKNYGACMISTRNDEVLITIINDYM